jgi:hypothetical protein
LTVKLSAFVKYLILKYFLPGQHLSIWLCHDENQKNKISHEQYQHRQGTAQRRKPQMNTDRHRSEGVAKKPAVTQQVKDFFHKNLCSSVFICGFNCFFHGMAGRRRRSSVNRIEEKI